MTNEHTIFCANTPCSNEATVYYETEDGWPMHLCAICGDAFHLGQANADPVAILRFIDSGIAVEESERDEDEDIDDLAVADYDEEEESDE